MQELPPGKETQFDIDVATELAFRAARTLLDTLKEIKVGLRHRTIYRVYDDTASGDDVPIPGYRDDRVWDRIQTAWDNENTRALTDLFWQHGAYRGTAHQERRSWERSVFDHLIEGPLRSVLTRTAIEIFIDTEDYERIVPWQVEDQGLRQAIRNQLERDTESKSGYRTSVGICPLMGVTLPHNMELVLPDGITLRKWSNRERAILASLNHSYFHELDILKTSVSLPYLAEITVKEKVGANSNKQNPIAGIKDRLDILKWALAVASGSGNTPSEGICLIQHRDATWFWFRRDETYRGGMTLDKDQMEKCVAYASRFLTASERFEGLRGALWHFGRACIATLDRDVILEAAIGLEKLLVPGGGELRYRFCLHGAAILAQRNGNGRQFYREFDAIYNKRSSAVHPKSKRKIKGKNTEELAPMARAYLAGVLAAIVDLISQNEIRVSEGNDIADAVQDYILDKITRVHDQRP